LQYLLLKPTIAVTGGFKIPYHSLMGSVEFKSVNFTYPTRPNQTVLNNFNLEIPAGRIVALVGLSGSGQLLQCVFDRLCFFYKQFEFHLNQYFILARQLTSVRTPRTDLDPDCILWKTCHMTICACVIGQLWTATSTTCGKLDVEHRVTGSCDMMSKLVATVVAIGAVSFCIDCSEQVACSTIVMA